MGESVLCEHCDACGSNACYKCEGTGLEWHSQWDDKHGLILVPTECHICGGIGEVVCGICEGTGVDTGDDAA